jgi:serine/threonine protein kinase
VDFGVEVKQCYIVLEWVEGTDLKKLLRQRGPLAIDESLRIAQQISEGLSHVHKAGLVHCDVKPQNVLLTSSGRAKLADFGVARLLSDKHRRPPEIAWATPQYFSPEQAAGENPSPASDVYSLGVVLFEMLSGRLPFPGQDPRTLAVEHLRHAPSPLQTLVPDVPVSVRSLVERMLEKDPRDRYRDGGEAAAALGQLSAELGYALLPLPASPSPGQASPSAAQEPEAADRREGGIDWKAVALGFVALVAVGGLVPLWVWVYLAYHPPFP